MARQIITGIDIGTREVRVVIAEETLEGGKSVHKIIGMGSAESKGLHHGYITNQHEATRSIMSAVKEAEKFAKIYVKRAFISVGGIGLSGVTTTGSAIVSRADLEITKLDLEKAQEGAETAIPHAVALNKKIINTIPIEYKTDGKVAWGRVLGLKAQKVDAKVLFIMCLEHHIQDLIQAVESADIEVIDVVAAPIAASFSTLSKNQKKAGCVLANIGAETLSIVVFENSNPVSLEVFPIGGNDITNDIALGLKVSLEEAESIKLGSVTSSNISKKKLEEIVTARLTDMFELIETHLKRIGRNALLPAGIVITGGGSSIVNIKTLAENTLKLPSKIAEIHFGEELKTKTRDQAWAVAYGLSIFGFNVDGEQNITGPSPMKAISSALKPGLNSLGKWFGQFLP
ncbi:MAG: cell division protein FtsA [Parcubacteria bacterium C7867-005]|nr:MAG: cell division protein FtsA [Parcubacteria bacterium C7867-005]